MSARWKMAAGLLVVIGLFTFFPWAAHHRAASALEAYRKQLAAQGEKLTIAEIAPHATAAEQTAAQDLISAIVLLSSTPGDYPSAMKSIAPGRALIAWAEEILPSPDSTNIWPRITRDLSGRTNELESLRAALENPHIRFELDYDQGALLPLPHLAKIKAAAIWLSVASLMELHEGHAAKALENLKSCLALLNPLEQEPLIISQLVRIAMAQIALNTTWELLQYPGWRDAELIGLQTNWDSLHFWEGAEFSLEMERAMIQGSYDFARSDYANYYSLVNLGGSLPQSATLGHLLTNPSESFEAFKDRPRYWAWKGKWSYDEELCNLQILEAGLVSVRTIRSNAAFVSLLKKLDENQATILDLYTNSRSGFLYANSSDNYILGPQAGVEHSFLLKIATIEMERRLLVTAIALKRCQLRTGKYPADLQELVPDYLKELPLDFMDGKPLRYHPNGDGTFLLYSVGEDGMDNGGDGTPTVSPGSNYPMWWRGRDAVWPMPATPEQEGAFRQKMAAERSNKESIKKIRPSPVLPESSPPATNPK